jgi:hypothetical protein
MNPKVAIGFVAGICFALLWMSAQHLAQGQAPEKDKFAFKAHTFPSSSEAVKTIRKLSEQGWEYIGLVETQNGAYGANTGVFKRRLK